MIADPQFWAIFIPLVTATVVWFANEASKRAAEEYIRKEKKYLELMAAIRGFYVGSDPSEAKRLKDEFIASLDTCWLYSPDAVIRAGYAFMDTVKTGASASDTEKERAYGEFVRQIRLDLLGRRFLLFRRTKLGNHEHKIFRST